MGQEDRRGGPHIVDARAEADLSEGRAGLREPAEVLHRRLPARALEGARDDEMDRVQSTPLADDSQVLEQVAMPGEEEMLEPRRQAGEVGWQVVVRQWWERKSPERWKPAGR